MSRTDLMRDALNGKPAQWKGMMLVASDFSFLSEAQHTVGSCEHSRRQTHIDMRHFNEIGIRKAMCQLLQDRVILNSVLGTNSSSGGAFAPNAPRNRVSEKWPKRETKFDALTSGPVLIGLPAAFLQMRFLPRTQYHALIGVAVRRT
jgi:hypothetical protein